MASRHGEGTGSWKVLTPHPYRSFYESMRQAATGDADDRSLVALADSLRKAEALRIPPLGSDLQAGLAGLTRESYEELQKCLGLHTIHSCFVYLRHE